MQNGKVGLAVVFNIFKTVKLFIQIKSHGEPQYIEELEADRLVKAEKAGDEGESPLRHPLELGLHSTQYENH